MTSAVRHLQIVPTSGDDESASTPPPNDLDAEAAVISAIIIDPKNAIPVVRAFLKPAHFFSEAHRRIAEAVYAVADSGADVDTVTVASHLKASGRLVQVGGMAYMTEVIAATPAVANIRSHAVVVFDRWRCRKIIEACEKYRAVGYVDRPNDVQAYAEEVVGVLAHIARMQPGKKRQTNHDVLVRIVQQATNPAPTRHGHVSGIPTGFAGIDRKIGGLHAGHKITIAAHPSRGKTTIGLQIAQHVAKIGISVVYFSAEQSHEELLLKVLSSRIEAPYLAIKNGTLGGRAAQSLVAEMDSVSKMPLAFEASPGMTVADIRVATLARVREPVPGEPPVGLIVVDHLHRLNPVESMAKSERTSQVAYDTKELKRLAQETKLPLIELAQLKDAKGKDGLPIRPEDNACAWSYDVQREADDLIYLHCATPKPYREITAIVHKCRFGETGDVPLLLQGEYSRFREVSPPEDDLPHGAFDGL